MLSHFTSSFRWCYLLMIMLYEYGFVCLFVLAHMFIFCFVYGVVCLVWCLVASSIQPSIHPFRLFYYSLKLSVWHLVIIILCVFFFKIFVVVCIIIRKKPFPLLVRRDDFIYGKMNIAYFFFYIKRTDWNHLPLYINELLFGMSHGYTRGGRSSPGFCSAFVFSFSSYCYYLNVVVKLDFQNSKKNLILETKKKKKQ